MEGVIANIVSAAPLLLNTTRMGHAPTTHKNICVYVFPFVACVLAAEPKCIARVWPKSCIPQVRRSSKGSNDNNSL